MTEVPTTTLLAPHVFLVILGLDFAFTILGWGKRSTAVFLLTVSSLLVLALTCISRGSIPFLSFLSRFGAVLNPMIGGSTVVACTFIFLVEIEELL